MSVGDSGFWCASGRAASRRGVVRCIACLLAVGPWTAAPSVRRPPARGDPTNLPVPTASGACPGGPCRRSRAPVIRLAARGRRSRAVANVESGRLLGDCGDEQRRRTLPAPAAGALRARRAGGARRHAARAGRGHRGRPPDGRDPRRHRPRGPRPRGDEPARDARRRPRACRPWPTCGRARPARSLPGALWRLYALREWVRRSPEQASREYAAGIRFTDVAHAVAGIAEPPRPEELQRVADQILAGVFEGDLAVALERAAAFCSVVAAGRAELAHDRDAVDPGAASDLTRIGASRCSRPARTCGPARGCGGSASSTDGRHSRSRIVGGEHIRRDRGVSVVRGCRAAAAPGPNISRYERPRAVRRSRSGTHLSPSSRRACPAVVGSRARDACGQRARRAHPTYGGRVKDDASLHDEQLEARSGSSVTSCSQPRSARATCPSPRSTRSSARGCAAIASDARRGHGCAATGPDGRLGSPGRGQLTAATRHHGCAWRPGRACPAAPGYPASTVALACSHCLAPSWRPLVAIRLTPKEPRFFDLFAASARHLVDASAS